MAVYVDSLFRVDPTKAWPYHHSCHLVADTPEELDAFADRLGLSPHWKQHRGQHNEHFDLTKARRKQALALGAQEIGWREMAMLFRRKRAATRTAVEAG